MHKRRPLSPLYIIIPIILLFSLLHYSGYTPTRLRAPAPVRTRLREPDPQHPVVYPQLSKSFDTSERPKLTIISIWDTRAAQDPTFIPYFFRSVEMNPNVNLLFLNIDRNADTTGCKTYTNAPNVRHVCMTIDQYFQHYVDFLCQRWQCSADERTIFFQYIKKMRGIDYNHSYFRILRNAVFAQYLDPDTTLWGWCDFDIFWGNFARVLPWDLLGQFDVIAINHQPALEDEHLLMTRGHMAFFRNSPEINAKLVSHPFFDSLEGYMSIKKSSAPEEYEFTHFVFSNSNFTFLLTEGNTRMLGAHFLTDGGVFIFQGDPPRANYTHEMRQSIAQSLLSLGPGSSGDVDPTFTQSGIEMSTTVKYSGIRSEKWAATPYLCYVETGPIYPDEKVYVMRREHGGGVTFRLEARERYLLPAGGIVIDEALYMHFRLEKRIGYFKNITQTPPGENEVWVHWNQKEGEVWDQDGNVLRMTSELVDVQLTDG